MELRDNEAGGQTVVLIAGDDLGLVSESHRHLITPAIRDAFADSTGCFRDVADRCRFQQMAAWLRALLAEGRWELQLHRGYGSSASAGFWWHCEKVRGAMIGLPCGQDLSGYPTTLREYYSLVDVVDWMGFGCAGGLSGAGEHPPLSAFRFDYHGADVDPENTFIWGASPCGDMLIYTADGRGGWLNHETHQIHLLGTAADTIDWVYAELLAKRCPEWDDRGWDPNRY